jgi:Flp pilus assembly pilin Flp
MPKNKPRKKYRRPFSGEGGASMVEYALLVSLIAALIVVSLREFGTQRQQKWDQVGDAFDEALSG